MAVELEEDEERGKVARSYYSKPGEIDTPGAGY